MGPDFHPGEGFRWVAFVCDILYVRVMFYVYITANRKQGALYTGQCSDLLNRIYEHKWKRYSGHTAKYGIDRLMWFEIHETRASAFKREHQIKSWKRAWRLALFEGDNPNWDDLFHGLNESELCDPSRMYPHDFSESEYQIQLANSR